MAKERNIKQIIQPKEPLENKLKRVMERPKERKKEKKMQLSNIN